MLAEAFRKANMVSNFGNTEGKYWIFRKKIYDVV
jgi:hypothetical protein